MQKTTKRIFGLHVAENSLQKIAFLSFCVDLSGIVFFSTTPTGVLFIPGQYKFLVISVELFPMVFRSFSQVPLCGIGQTMSKNIMALKLFSCRAEKYFSRRSGIYKICITNII